MNGTALTTGTNTSVISSLSQAETGAPAWADLRTTAGTATAARFYCSLFGWTVVARHRPMDESAGYWVFQHGEVAMGGLAADEDASWTMYVRVADVRASVDAVATHGGTVVAEPVRTLDGGRLAVCTDPFGARFAVWESPEDPPTLDVTGAPTADGVGAPVDVRPGTPAPAGYQLLCADAPAAAVFYAAVLGWIVDTVACDAGTRCARFLHPVTGRLVAMAVEVDADQPDRSGRWMVHLPVGDADDAVVRAAELGGSVSVAPFEVPGVGRVAVLTDPELTTFSVLQVA
jgi:uncharacterized protein